MALGQITKQIAQQALGNQVKSVVDALRPPDLSKVAESLTGPKPAAPVGHETDAGAVILNQIQAMQKALREEEELVVLCETAAGVLRVLEFFVPAQGVFVLTGIDTDKTVTRVVTTAATLQLVCKPMPAPAGAKATRLRFVVPKAKE